MDAETFLRKRKSETAESFVNFYSYYCAKRTTCEGIIASVKNTGTAIKCFLSFSYFKDISQYFSSYFNNHQKQTKLHQKLHKNIKKSKKSTHKYTDKK